MNDEHSTKIDVGADIVPEKFKALQFNEAELHLHVESKDNNTHWIECAVEVQSPMSLAPDKRVPIGRTLIGIFRDGVKREKRVKVFTGSDAMPNTYKIKLTFYIYDEDGAIEDRREILKEVECKNVDLNAKVL